MPSNALYRTPEGVMNALSGPQGPLGMNPNVNRLSLLPRYNQREGLVAPQWLYDLARAAEAPGNALMGHQTTPEEALNFAGNVAGAGLGSSAMMRSPAPGPGRTVAATVYHGSPHNFDKFDMSKIGTGEGAQAYGHGLYVAESPGVAKQYQTQLASGEPLLNGAPLSSVMDSLPISDEAKKILAYNLKAGPADPARVERFAKQGIPEYQEAWSVLQKTTPNKGKMYSVDLPDSAIENMLDWDAPLSQQPALKKAFSQISDEIYDQEYAKRGREFEHLIQTPDYTGTATGEDAYNSLARILGSQQAATERLKSLGISGIRYLDGGSRASGEGTRNFVVFDDKLLKILGKE